MNRIALVLVVAVGALGTFCAVQAKKLRVNEVKSLALESELEQKTRQVDELKAAQERLEQHKGELLRQNDELAAQLRMFQAKPATGEQPEPMPATNAPTLPASNPAGTGLGGMLGKMMSDPDTKKFIRNQQRIMMDQLYKPLIKQLGLTPEEASTFKDLLADNMMKRAEKATSLFGGGSSTNRAELMSAIAAEQNAADEQIKAFLGDDRYSVYKSYQETAGERTQLNLFRQQNDAGEYPLNDIQVEQLLALMKDEKRNVAASLGQPSTGMNQAAVEGIFSQEQGDKLISSQEAANQRIFERARSVLSPDQLLAFGQFQTNQLQMMRMGMSMARKLMIPANPGDETSSGQ